MTAMPETTNVFLACNGEVGHADLEKIALSLLTHGDKIWIPASFSISPLLAENLRKKMLEKIDSLISADLVRLWALEEETSRAARRPHQIVTTTEQAELTEAIDNIVLPSAGSVITNRPPNQIDTASRVIETRHELWHLGIAAQCEAPSIVASGSNRKNRKNTSPNFHNLRDCYAEKMFDAFQMPPLSILELEDILSLRKNIRGYRQRIDDLLIKEPTASVTDESIISDCRSEFQTYLHIVQDALKSKASIRNTSNAYEVANFALEVAGHAVPMAGLLPLSRKFYHWLTNRHKYRFAFYLHQIKTTAVDRHGVADNKP